MRINKGEDGVPELVSSPPTMTGPGISVYYLRRTMYILLAGAGGVESPSAC